MDEALYFCDVQMTDARFLVLYANLLFGNVINLALCAIFIAKLRRILSANEDNQHIKLRFKSLIVKNAVLTIAGSVSTITAYALWVVAGGVTGAPLYIDLVCNCVIIGLFFKTNENHYRRLCRVCILVCLVHCDHSKSKLEKQETIEYVEKGIDALAPPNMELTVLSESSQHTSVQNVD